MDGAIRLVCGLVWVISGVEIDIRVQAVHGGHSDGQG
jgi:hypothetical protein